jgi:hypothetical protein
MNWDAIGAIAELMGALGVIATLGYLAVQLRHNTAALRGNSHEVGAERLTTSLQSLVGNPELALLVGRASRDYAELDYVEKLQIGSYWTAIFTGAEVSMLQWRLGNLDEAVWQRDFSILRPWLHTPGVHEWYARSTIDFTPEFRILVEREAQSDTPDA